MTGVFRRFKFWGEPTAQTERALEIVAKLQSLAPDMTYVIRPSQHFVVLDTTVVSKEGNGNIMTCQYLFDDFPKHSFETGKNSN